MKPDRKVTGATEEACCADSKRTFLCNPIVVKLLAAKFISMLLFFVSAACLIYLSVLAMDACNVIDEIQHPVMLLMGVGVGVVGFNIFKKSFY
ncbi:MAG: hypothetical protein ABUT20_20755 [Bacteroidota bacterium]